MKKTLITASGVDVGGLTVLDIISKIIKDGISIHINKLNIGTIHGMSITLRKDNKSFKVNVYGHDDYNHDQIAILSLFNAHLAMKEELNKDDSKPIEKVTSIDMLQAGDLIAHEMRYLLMAHPEKRGGLFEKSLRAWEEATGHIRGVKNDGHKQ